MLSTLKYIMLFRYIYLQQETRTASSWRAELSLGTASAEHSGEFDVTTTEPTGNRHPRERSLVPSAEAPRRGAVTFVMPRCASLVACSLEKREGKLSVKEKGSVTGSVSSQQMCRVIKGSFLPYFVLNRCNLGQHGVFCKMEIQLR